jgi:Bacterial PH domain
MSYVPLAREPLSGPSPGAPHAGFYTRTPLAFGAAAAVVGLTVLLLGVVALIALLSNPNAVDVALAVAVVAAFGCAAVLLLRWSVRLWRMRLTVGAGGVVVLGPRRNHHLRWEQIRDVRPVTVASLRPWATNVAVVVVDVAGGDSVIVHALRFGGGWARSAPSERVGQARAMCYEIERLRPQPKRTAGVRKRSRSPRTQPPRTSARPGPPPRR